MKRKPIDKGGLASSLARLPTLERIDLVDEWQKYYGCLPPANMSRGLLVRAIAYRMQELAYGGLKPAVRRFLEKTAQKAAADKSAVRPPALSMPKPGVRLLREWHGKVYEAVILEDGVMLDGKRYHSLSEAAHAITGVKWSGPRFFGLRKAGGAA